MPRTTHTAEGGARRSADRTDRHHRARLPAARRRRRTGRAVGLHGRSPSAVTTVPEDRWDAFDDGTPADRGGTGGNHALGFIPVRRRGLRRGLLRDHPARGRLHRSSAAADARGGRRGTRTRRHPGRSRCSARRPVYSSVPASASTGSWPSATSAQIDAWTGTGGALSIIANRLSYFLDLHGPSLTIDTACSSSLVAVHLACQSLRTGQSELAIAGGVNLVLSPVITRTFDEAEAMSPTGACHAFDAAADGFVRGEGCGVAVLKRLSDALRDGDRVLAVVRGSAVNQDGRSNGLMAPNPAAQAAVLRAALRRRRRGARRGGLRRGARHRDACSATLSRPERWAPSTDADAHPVPRCWSARRRRTSATWRRPRASSASSRQRWPCSAARSRPTSTSTIPIRTSRSTNFGLKVVDEAIEWPATGRPRRAGVSSFGFGGTNAHVVAGAGARTRSCALAAAASR